MAYKLRCNACRSTFVTSNRNTPCPHCRPDRDYGSTFIEDVLDVAVGVAVGYATGSLIEDGISAAADVVGSLFDW